jgi:two-component system sensor histidine kinase UhpB
MSRKRLASTTPQAGGDAREQLAAAASIPSPELQKVAEQALRFGSWDWDLVTQQLICTPQLEAIYGLEPGAFGRAYRDFSRRVHPQDLADVERCRDEAVAAGRPFDVQFRIIRPDGELRWVRSQGDAVRDAQGKTLRIVGINVDITEQRQMQLALQVNESRLHTALKLSDLLIFHQDRQLRYAWIANPALGARVEELIGRRDEDLLGQEGARPLTTIKRRVLRTGRGERQEVWVTNNGQTGCFELIAEPERGPDGRITGLICAATDITKRKQAEDHLKLQATILENLEEGVNLADEQGILRYTNPKFDAMFGYARGELLGQPAAVLNAPGPRTPDETARSILGALQRGGHWSGDLLNRRKNGDEFWTRAHIVASSHPVFGKIWISVQSDITSMRHIQQERDTAYQMVARLADHLQDTLEEQRRALAREVHDQIGATLTGIRMQLEALAGRAGLQGLSMLLELVDGAMARTRALSSELRPPMLDDLGLAETLRWYVRDWTRQTGILARLRISPPAREPTDPLRIDLFRMLQELLTNVARHSGATRVSVTLGQGSGKLRLRVSDDGHGFRGEQTTGLGLLGIRERLRRHGGQMLIDSGPGGTAVTLSIPRRSP